MKKLPLSPLPSRTSLSKYVVSIHPLGPFPPFVHDNGIVKQGRDPMVTRAFLKGAKRQDQNADGRTEALPDGCIVHNQTRNRRPSS